MLIPILEVFIEDPYIKASYGITGGIIVTVIVPLV